MSMRGNVLAVLAFSLICPGCRVRNSPTGIYVNVLRRGRNLSASKDESDNYILTIISKRRVQIRGEEIPFENLDRRIQEVFRTRVERLLLVKVEGQVYFQDVVEILDRASSQTRLQFALMTKRVEPTAAEPSLFMAGEPIYTSCCLR